MGGAWKAEGLLGYGREEMTRAILDTGGVNMKSNRGDSKLGL